ncbi:MAG: hypothetical protein U1F66_04415 [bacterium]
MGPTRLGSRRGQTVADFNSGTPASPADPGALSLGESQRRELAAIAQEADPELLARDLLNFARRQETAGRLEVAAELYRRIAAYREAPNSLQQAAQRSLDTLLGHGSFGGRAEFLMRNLAGQASDPSTLLAMGAAGAVFRVTRLAVGSRLLGASAPGFLTRSLGAGRLATLAGFAAEAPTFTLMARLGNQALGRQQDWGLAALGKDLAASYLTLGGLKLAGGAAAALGTGQAAPLRGLLHQGGMLSGILLGHRLEEWAGLRPHQDEGTTLTDSLAMLLQFNLAGSLTRTAFGPRFATWEAGLDLQSAALAEAHPLFTPKSGPTLLPAALGGALPPTGDKSLGLEVARPVLMSGDSQERGYGEGALAPVLRPRQSSNPPPDQGVLGRDAVKWGAAQNRDPEDVRLVALLAAKIRVAMWNELNLRIEGPLARDLARRAPVEVRLTPLDGSLENYEVELLPAAKTLQVSGDEVRFLLNSAEGYLRLKDYLPNARWEMQRQQRGEAPLRGFIPFFRSIVNFRSEGLKSQYLVDTLPPDAREFVLMEPTQQGSSKEKPVSQVKVTNPKEAVTLDANHLQEAPNSAEPSILVRFFPRVAHGIREATDRYLDEMMIRGEKERDRLHRLMQRVLLALHQRESEHPEFAEHPYLQVWIRPSPQGARKRSLEILTPGEAMAKNLAQPFGENDIMLILVRAPSPLSDQLPILEHQYLRLNPKNPSLPAGADLEFQRDLGLGDHLKLKVRVDELSRFPPGFFGWEQWMRDNGY